MRAALVLVVSLTAVSSVRAVPEARWQVAWNELHFEGRGELEVVVPGGRCDILTEEWAIEVDHVYKYREGIRQSRHYARMTGRRPGLALFVDSPSDTREKLAHARRVARRLGIRVWVINDELDPARTFRDPPPARGERFG